MGVRNYLIEGVSGAGKTSVCDELRRRGYHSAAAALAALLRSLAFEKVTVVFEQPPAT